MEYADLSVEEIQRQLEEAESKKAQLRQLLEVRHEERKDDVAQQVKDLILSNGYELDEIISMIAPRRRRGPGAPRKLVSSRQYKRYVDPENSENVYVRGVLPGWMKQKMRDEGYDPSSKDDREAFKAKSLRLVEG
ncbi:H-NS histone family protein [Thiorhodococcus mannitoliphagus]|uniref:H-NS histone family protein n=1 Tax=Thiorhodococcus mannitoliphagus TaxID=329406 RepID=A0A6P1DPR3_9GAMM|nr:H-NS histone family protein [Thiorhodococcus mannitoliphagus]